MGARESLKQPECFADFNCPVDFFEHSKVGNVSSLKQAAYRVATYIKASLDAAEIRNRLVS